MLDPPSKLQIIERRVGDVTILELVGEITLDDGDLVFRRKVHELLDETERARDSVSTTLEVTRARVIELMAMHDDASREAAQSRAELASLRERLRQWSGTVERALDELVRGSRSLNDD